MEYSHNLLQVQDAFFLRLTEYKGIIKVDDRKSLIKIENLIHEAREGTWCIRQSKWHD